MFSGVSFCRLAVSPCLVRFYRGRSDPGISKRLKLFKQESSNVDALEIDDEIMDDMESDFMNSREIYSFHKSEIHKMKKMIEFSQVERKYFGRVKYPNMLTYSEKDQIRQLYNSDPDVWTVEKLSQSFPAMPHVIKKILKNQWKLKDPADILRHDNAVTNNWKKLKDGSLAVDPASKEYFLSFTDRDRPAVSNPYEDSSHFKEISVAPNNGEFSQIISNYKEQIGHPDAAEVDREQVLHFSEGKRPFVNFSPEHGSKHVTLDELRKSVKQSLGLKGYLREHADQHFLEVSNNKPTQVQPIQEENIETLSTEPKSKFASVVVEDPQPEVRLSATTEVPQKIRIPNKLKSKGSLFKKTDCYYDRNGYFLYRVPGMVS